VKHFQGSYWTFDGNLWKYEENGHKYTENSGIPDRNIFVAKSIQTLANSPQECKGWKICWIVEKYWKQTWCKILSSAQNRYPDITNWQIGRLRMKQWSVNVINMYENLKPIGNDRGIAKPLKTTTKDMSSLNDSPGLVNTTVIHSDENNIFTPEREAREAKSTKALGFMTYFLIGLITCNTVMAFIAGIGFCTCIMLCRKRCAQKVWEPDNTRFIEQADSYELLGKNTSG